MNITSPNVKPQGRGFLGRFVKPSSGSSQQLDSLGKYAHWPALKVVTTLCEHEEKRQQAPIQLGKKLHSYLLAPSEHGALQSSAQSIECSQEGGTFPLFLQALLLSEAGNIHEAQNLVSQAIVKNRQPTQLAEVGVTVSKKRAVALCKISWILQALNIQSIEGGVVRPRLNMSVREVSDRFGDFGRLDVASALFARQPLTDEHTRTRYLEKCRTVFKDSASFTDELKVILSILNGRPHQFEAYNDSFVLARELYEGSRNKWNHLLGPLNKGGSSQSKNPMKTVTVLALVLKIATRLGQERDADVLCNALMAFASLSWGRSTKWFVARTLMEVNPEAYWQDLDVLIGSRPDHPSTKVDLYHYLIWALERGLYASVMTAFEDWPKSLRHHECALIYAEALRRVGRFEAARKAMITYNGAALSRPHNFCPASVWATYFEIKKLDALIALNTRYLGVAQPSAPKGLVVLTNANQSVDVNRLNALKQQGWSVLCLTEGVLTAQATGIAEIDSLQNSLNCHHLISRREFFGADNTCEDLELNVKTGEFFWRGLNFTGGLQAYAANMQRKFNIEFDDPRLKMGLETIKATMSTAAQMVSHIQETAKTLNLKTVILTEHNDDFPSLMYYRYCEAFGNPEDLVSMNIADFVSKDISQNIAAPEASKAQNTNVIYSSFEDYVSCNMESLDELREKAKVVAGLPEEARPPNDLHQNARLVLLRIKKWRDAGGNVACVFGNLSYHGPHFTRGSAVHKDAKDWINHTVTQVAGSKALLLIMPHPLEARADGTLRVSETLTDLIDASLSDNVIVLGHDWFEIGDLEGRIDLGLTYANTDMAIAAGLINVPCVDASRSWVKDVPVGHVQPASLDDYANRVRFETHTQTGEMLSARTALWMNYNGQLPAA